MRAMTWLPMASVRPVARMGMGVSDMIDLVMDLYPCESPQIWLDVHDKYMFMLYTSKDSDRSQHSKSRAHPSRHY